MQKYIHRADTLGQTRTDWLHSRHSFSFAEYYDPKENEAYLFVLNGRVHIDDDRLNARDGTGIEGAEDISMIFDDHTTYVIFEVPML